LKKLSPPSRRKNGKAKSSCSSQKVPRSI
jgi:hypothetical protein